MFLILWRLFLGKTGKVLPDLKQGHWMLFLREKIQSPMPKWEKCTMYNSTEPAVCSNWANTFGLQINSWSIPRIQWAQDANESQEMWCCNLWPGKQKNRRYDPPVQKSQSSTSWGWYQFVLEQQQVRNNFRYRSSMEMEKTLESLFEHKSMWSCLRWQQIVFPFCRILRCC